MFTDPAFSSLLFLLEVIIAICPGSSPCPNGLSVLIRVLVVSFAGGGLAIISLSGSGLPLHPFPALRHRDFFSEDAPLVRPPGRPSFPRGPVFLFCAAPSFFGLCIRLLYSSYLAVEFFVIPLLEINPFLFHCLAGLSYVLLRRSLYPIFLLLL